jgi:uncharacterized ubiquitin-like protein YukD
VADHVDVTVVAPGLRADLRIPTRLTVHRLVTELALIFPGLDAGMPKYRLRVPGTPLLLTEEDVLADHPVSDGAVLELDPGGPRAT